jgi:hypothetical protein
MEFKCNCVCPEGEDNELELIVIDGVRHVFHIKEDGQLKIIDSDGLGQEIYLQCPLCGTKFEFKSNDIFLEEVFVLKKLDNYSCSSKDMMKEDYDIKIIK